MTYQPRYTPPTRSAAECAWLWPTVVMRAASGQDRDFALRIEQQLLRPGWEPTPMQLDLMRSMVAHYCPDGIRADLDLLTGADLAEKVFEEVDISPCERCGSDGATLHAVSGDMLCPSCSSSNRRAYNGTARP